MLERFNRRINQAIGREDKRGSAHRLFASHADRDRFLTTFANDYNHTRLKCLDYKAPKQMLANLAGPNTKAGIMRFGWFREVAFKTGRHEMARALLVARAQLVRQITAMKNIVCGLLKTFGQVLPKRLGRRFAAAARKLAVILHRMWSTGERFAFVARPVAA